MWTPDMWGSKYFSFVLTFYQMFLLEFVLSWLCLNIEMHVLFSDGYRIMTPDKHLDYLPNSIRPAYFKILDLKCSGNTKTWPWKKKGWNIYQLIFQVLSKRHSAKNIPDILRMATKVFNFLPTHYRIVK